MSMKIALVGNPNSGKTTLFNNLTGSSQYIGNWPGVTVERKEGKLKGHKDITVQDLPGIYSLSPYSPEEIITRDYILNDKPDVIINIIDATNIERNLYLTTQLLELNVPMVVAVNMSDLLESKGLKLDLDALSKVVGCKAMSISALKNMNNKEIANLAIEVANAKVVPSLDIFSSEFNSAISEISAIIKPVVSDELAKYTAIKLFERDERVVASTTLNVDQTNKINAVIEACEKQEDDDSVSIVINERYAYITSVISQVVTKSANAKASMSDKIDSIVTNRILAFPIFVAVMFVVYYISITTLGAYLTDYTNDTVFGETLLPAVQSLLEGMNVAPWLVSLTVDGIIGGVGAVLGFVPQMLVLFFLLAILEECGYMARVAFIMDRMFRRFGLSGKSFIPMLIGSGCGIPGVMASRTIESERDRKITIMTTTFIPCGAKMPIVALIAGALFGGAWWVAPSAYFIGMAAIVISGLILKNLKMFAGNPAPFIMEMPSYHMPMLFSLFSRAWERGWSFIKRAGTVILVASIFIWFLSSLGFQDGSLAMVDDMDHSLLANIGNTFAFLFAPLGFGTWQSAVATIMGLVAKEEVVGVFGVLYGVSGDALALVEEGSFGELGGIAVHFTALSAYSFLIFNLLFAPCFAAIGAMKRELGSTKWTLFAIGYLTVFAYSMSFIIYQLGLVFTGQGSFGIGAIIAILLIIGVVYLIVRKPNHEAKVSGNVATSL